MTDGEVFEFIDVLKSVTRVFPIRGTDDDVHQLGVAYFKALKRYPLNLVAAGAEVCIERGKHFPKPTEWAANIPKAGTTQDIDIPMMSADEARERHRAELLRYEDHPCTCRVCRAAGVHTRPIRFVPDFNADDSDRKVRDPLSEKVYTAGHWAHGEELARWYAAKEHFWALVRTDLRQRSFPPTTGYLTPRPEAPMARMTAVMDREPGSDDE